MVLVDALPPWQAPPSPSLTSAETDDPPLEIIALDAREQRAQLDAPQKLTAEEERRKKEEEQIRPEGQVVDIARPLLEQRPEQARYLSEYDSQVKKETRGPSGKGQGGAKLPTPASPPVPITQPGRPGPLGPPAPLVAALQPRPSARPVAPSPPRSEAEPTRLGPDGTLSPAGAREGSAPRSRPSPVPPGGGLPSLSATPQVLERALGIGAPGTLDALKEVEEGDSTSLSAKKWKFAVFFNRIKRAVAGEWHPDTEYLKHDPSGNIYGIKDRVTVLRVQLDSEGEITKLEVVKPSGVDFLDDEAQAAFKRAQPFLNPPPQLVEADGQIRFNFGFYFELSGKPSFKVFRY